MIKGKYLSINNDLSEVINVRYSVFGDMNTDINPFAMNVLVYDEQIPVATGSIIYDEGVFTIEGIGVLSQHRNKGFGEFTLRLLADKALLAGGKEVFLECSKKVSSFFQKYYFDIYKEKDNTVMMKVNLEQFKPACGGNCSTHQ